MYLTALHVQDGQRREDWQAYLHRHVTPHQGFPTANPLSVPQEHPGVMVAQLPPILPPGGNAVLSYLDIIVDENAWMALPPWSRETSTAFWHRSLDLAELMFGKPLPWVVEAGDVHIVFNANPLLELVGEYSMLLDTAMRLWEEWRTRQRLR